MVQFRVIFKDHRPVGVGFYKPPVHHLVADGTGNNTVTQAGSVGQQCGPLIHS
jgi:hypothetical protein